MAAEGTFQPQGNAVALSTSIVSSTIANALEGCAVIVATNRSTGNGWVSWAKRQADAVAKFPVPGDPAGSFGMEVPPGAQISINVGGSAYYLAAILDSGTGVMSFVPGNGI